MNEGKIRGQNRVHCILYLICPKGLAINSKGYVDILSRRTPLSTKTKVITLADHIVHRESREIIKTRINYIELEQREWKRVPGSHFWLDEKVTRVVFSQSCSLVMQNLTFRYSNKNPSLCIFIFECFSIWNIIILLCRAWLK